jgi:hypothetical protein
MRITHRSRRCWADGSCTTATCVSGVKEKLAQKVPVVGKPCLSPLKSLLLRTLSQRGGGARAMPRHVGSAAAGEGASHRRPTGASCQHLDIISASASSVARRSQPVANPDATGLSDVGRAGCRQRCAVAGRSAAHGRNTAEGRMLANPGVGDSPSLVHAGRTGTLPPWLVCFSARLTSAERAAAAGQWQA